MISFYTYYIFHKMKSRSSTPGFPHTERPVAEVPKATPVAAKDTQNLSMSERAARAERTISQLEKVVSEFAVKYPTHTQKIPAIRPGESPLISFVRSMAASMAAKQEELEALNEQVVEAACEKERFLANMSHEVRTPMNGIFGLVNLLLEMDLEPVQREYLETIHASSESLLNILDDVLDYAKLNASEVKLKARQFDINKLIRDVLLVYQPAAKEKSIGLSASICKTLSDEIIADDLRIKQVLSNLVSNALKFTEEGEVTVTVQPIVKGGVHHLLFRITDSGIGIPTDEGKSLFSPFHQVEDTSNRPDGGTGLGLAISRNLVELMGGEIWFESEVNVGTSFYFGVNFELPEAELEEVPPAVSHDRGVNSESRLDRLSDKILVLLVEDNKVNQKVASLTLEQLGCEVITANNGKEAVDLASGSNHFDLICMDVNMPVMNGMDSAKAIRQLDHENSSTRILAMTGMAFDEDRERCLAAGMDRVITKPFDIDDLRAEVDSVRHVQGESVALPG